ncbi:MAG: hypothetical protein Q8903_08360 [Bacteroidota bacterium]|nr:hypothetical protein [Bacteroidota bacterium]
MKLIRIYEKKSLRYTIRPSELPDLEVFVNSEYLPLSEDCKNDFFSAITNLSNYNVNIDGLYNCDIQKTDFPFNHCMGVYFYNFPAAVNIIEENFSNLYDSILEEIYNLVCCHNINIFDRKNVISIEFKMLIQRKYVSVNVFIPFYELPSWGKEIYNLESLYKFIIELRNLTEFDKIFIELIDREPFWKIIKVNNVMETINN